MNILVWLLLFFSAMLGLLVFTSPNKVGKKQGEQKGPSGDSEKALISTLEDQLFSAREELEKIKASYANLQGDAELTKKRELDLRQELMRQKDWYDKKTEELEKLKSDYLPIKNKLEKEISQDLSLNKEIQEKDDIIESLRKGNKEMSDEVQSLKAQIQNMSRNK